MLTRLSKTRRLKAGWCIALAYLLCVLAPGISFAFADGSRQAPCIIEDHGPGMHRHETALDRHVHDASAVHDHHSHGPVKADEGGTLPAKGTQKTSDNRCCGLIFLSAIAAGEIALFKPAAPSSRCATESCRDVADRAPPKLYRPPIS